jgi:IS605 OrfB family transposase
MKLTAQIKLLPTPEQAQALLKTVETANAACNYISNWAWEINVFSQFPLHKMVYREVRDTFQLSAQVVIRCISKVANAYKIDRKTKHFFKQHGAIAFDNRILSFNLEHKEVSIWTIDGRQHIPFSAGKRQLELLSGQRGESDLCYIKDKFYLFVSCEVEEAKQIDVDGMIGVDLGIVNIASDSDGEQFSGKAIDENRHKFEHRRKNLQKKGTKSAKRKLKKISGKQSRFQSHTNHLISKRLVEKAQGTQRAIALENLSGIREATVVRRSQRARHANWAFYDLRAKIVYKAKLAGVPVFFVDPKYTSQTCSQCGHISKSNRKSQSNFTCNQCGFSANADYNAAVNIAARATVNSPMVSNSKSSGTMPRQLAAG